MDLRMVILLQVITLQCVLSYPLGDYIFAYIPIEEFEYLTNIETYPISSYQLVFPEDYEIRPIIIIDEFTYYTSPFNFLNQRFPVCSVSTTFPVFQPISVPAISVLPAVSLPAISISTPSVFPTTSISIPRLPVTCVKYNDDTPVADVILPAVDPVLETVSTPISGTVAFNGQVPVSGKIKIFAQCF